MLAISHPTPPSTLFSEEALASKTGLRTFKSPKPLTKEAVVVNPAKSIKASMKQVLNPTPPLFNLSSHRIDTVATSSFSGILNAVKSLRSKYPNYAVKCTGHSLGAALSQITAMMLKDNGITPATIYNFGQPRVGDPNYSACASSYVPTERVTHLKDTVPHIPYESWGYKHECREAYESSSTASNPQVKNCDASNCEDSSCSNQWAFKETNVDDHMLYLGLSVTCSAVS
jgi:hypothetical protein